MAYPNLTLIGALRQAAARLRDGAPYAWGHHGSCNCGHLLQVVTHLSKEEILKYAHTGRGEWTEIAEDYCDVSNAPAYMLIGKLEAIGLTPTDIHYLEYLKDRAVLDRLPGGFRWLQKNTRADVVLYFETFAQVLEEKLEASTPPAALPSPIRTDAVHPGGPKGEDLRTSPVHEEDSRFLSIEVTEEEPEPVLV